MTGRRETEVDQDHSRATASRHVIHVCDVHQFTAVTAELGDRVGDFLDGFYTRLGEIAVQRGGQVLDYVGDCIVFLFGAEGELAAVQGAFAMRQEFARLLADYGLRCESELENGIAAGDVVVRVVGHPTLRLLQAFGRAVNEASLLGCHRGVAVTAAVRERIEPPYTTRQLPSVPVKWSREPLAAWAVMEPESGPGAAPRTSGANGTVGGTVGRIVPESCGSGAGRRGQWGVP